MFAILPTVIRQLTDHSCFAFICKQVRFKGKYFTNNVSSAGFFRKITIPRRNAKPLRYKKFCF